MADGEETYWLGLDLHPCLPLGLITIASVKGSHGLAEQILSKAIRSFGALLSLHRGCDFDGCFVGCIARWPRSLDGRGHHEMPWRRRLGVYVAEEGKCW